MLASCKSTVSDTANAMSARLASWAALSPAGPPDDMQARTSPIRASGLTGNTEQSAQVTAGTTRQLTASAASTIRQRRSGARSCGTAKPIPSPDTSVISMTNRATLNTSLLICWSVTGVSN